MFVFAIWERIAGALFSRDPRHQAALFLYASRGRLRFASTLPALLAAGGVDTSIDPAALHHYMIFGGAYITDYKPGTKPETKSSGKSDTKPSAPPSGVLSALAMDKPMAKKVFEAAGLRCPKGKIVSREAMFQAIRFSGPMSPSPPMRGRAWV